MAMHPIGVACGTDMASVGGYLSKVIELHESMRGIERTRHTPFMGLTELGPQALVCHALLPLKGLYRWELVEGEGEIDRTELLE